MQRLLLRSFLITLCLFTTNISANGPVPHQHKITPQAPDAAPARLWNLQDADILGVINEVSLETGKNFIVDPKVSGKISLISSKPIKPDQVYALFLSVLELLGYSAIPTGDAVKIIPSLQSGEVATRVATASEPGTGDEVVVRVVPLDNISANQLIPIIRPLLPQWSNVSTYAPGNTIILLGRAANLERILRIIHEVDTASNNEIDVVALHSASASQLATVLTNLQNGSRSSLDTPQASIAADERTNSILLSGNKPARLRMHFLINQLDTPSNGAQGNTEVVYLRYLQAKTFAPVLQKIAKNINEKDNDISTTSADNPNMKAGAADTKELKTGVNIQPELSTNSLIITAPPSLMKSLNTVISKLDIRPAQVLIEGIIVEIDQNDTSKFGIQWGGHNLGNGNFALGTVGIIPGGPQIQAILTTLQGSVDANILSTPSVVVLDNHKASLAIGQDIPQTTGSYATTGNATTATPFTTTGRLKVELNLQVTPQINLGNTVGLVMKLKNDSLQNPDDTTDQPRLNTSTISNSVLVNSKDILVIGGLTSNNITNTVDKIPLLGDLPLIGKAFQNKARRLEKKNLMVFIKPTILHDADDSNSITNTKYSATRSAQIHWPEKLNDEGKQKLANILPPRQGAVDLPKPFED